MKINTRFITLVFLCAWVVIPFVSAQEKTSPVLQQLHPNTPTEAYLGVLACPLEAGLTATLPLTEGEQGLLLVSTDPQGPAAAAGILQGDILVALNGATVRSSQELQDAITRLSPGEEVALRLIRQGERIEQTCLLAEKMPLISPPGIAGRGNEVANEEIHPARRRIEELLADQMEELNFPENQHHLAPQINTLIEEMFAENRALLNEAFAEVEQQELLNNATSRIEMHDEAGKVIIIEQSGKKTIVELYDNENNLLWCDSILDKENLENIPREHRNRVREALNMFQFHFSYEAPAPPMEEGEEASPEEALPPSQTPTPRAPGTT